MIDKKEAADLLTGLAGAVSKSAMESVMARKPVDHEKLEFIRESALQIYTASYDRKAEKFKEAPLTAWLKAKLLWDAKPMDC